MWQSLSIYLSAKTERPSPCLPYMSMLASTRHAETQLGLGTLSEEDCRSTGNTQSSLSLPEVVGVKCRHGGLPKQTEAPPGLLFETSCCKLLR